MRARHDTPFIYFFLTSFPHHTRRAVKQRAHIVHTLPLGPSNITTNLCLMLRVKTALARWPVIPENTGQPGMTFVIYVERCLDIFKQVYSLFKNIRIWVAFWMIFRRSVASKSTRHKNLHIWFSHAVVAHLCSQFSIFYTINYWAIGRL